MDTAATVIQVGPVWSQITLAPPGAIATLREALTVRRKGAEYVARKYPGYTGEIRFLHITGRFPTGLLVRVLGLLQDPALRAQPVRLDRSRLADPPLRPLTTGLHGVTLRPYQVDACDRALALRRCAIQAPTGSGKTEVAAELVRRTGLRTLYLVHRKALLEQTAERLRERLRVPIIVVGGAAAFRDRWNAEHGRFGKLVVAMVQTLARPCAEHAAYLRGADMLFVDETHHASASTWYALAMQCPAPYRFGLSGTPLTGDPVRDLQLEAATGPLLATQTTVELADQGFLAMPRVVLLNIGRRCYPSRDVVRSAAEPRWRMNPRLLQTKGGALWGAAYRMGITDNPARNAAICRTASRHAEHSEKVLVLVSRVEHGERLHRAFLADHPHPVWWLSGDEKDVARKAALDDFRELAEGGILVASPIFDEGVDIPEVDVLILAGAGGKGHADDVPATVTLQRVGRGLRRRPDKDEVLVYDFQDGANLADAKDYLAQHSLKRRRDYLAQGWVVEEQPI